MQVNPNRTRTFVYINLNRNRLVTMCEPELILQNIKKNLQTCAAMRNILCAFQNLMSLKQAGSRTEPEPVKNAFFR